MNRACIAGLCVLLGVACGDDSNLVTGQTDTDGSSSTGATSEGTENPTASGSTSDASTTSQSTDSDGSTTAAEPLEVQTEVTLHETQPMVVDVEVVTSVPATVELAHTLDEGVRIEHTEVAADTHRFRVRGLAPATSHAVQWTASTDQSSEQGQVDFTTNAPLPGFVASFTVEGDPPDPQVPFRMFDLTPFPAFDTSGVFMVDAEGITRWHLGAPSTGEIGPESIWSSVKQLDDGSVMFLAGHEMFVQNELGETLLSFTDADLGQTGLHHELLMLPNGNFMALSHTFQTVTYPNDGDLLVAGDGIVEFTAAGEVVWTWDTFDHLDPLRTRTGFSPPVIPDPDSGELAHDWTHGNGIEYDPDTDTLLFSMRHQDWIIKIDHVTGEVLWRLGEEGDFTLAQGGRWFYHQHSPQWQPDGSLLLYDNAVDDPNLPADQWESRAVRYELDEATMTATQVWEDDAEPFVSTFAGDTDLLPGGHYLVTDSSIVAPDDSISARIRELDPEASPMTQWELTTGPGFFIYRATAHERLVGEVP